MGLSFDRLHLRKHVFYTTGRKHVARMGEGEVHTGFW
jgi:hypothetical protein